jgi:CHAT domain-containing protein/tetratricopeptide (TPR) repeat protein
MAMATLDRTVVADALQAFINAGNPHDAIEVFRRHSAVLLSDSALELLDSNLARFPDDKEAQSIFGLRRQAIVAGREHGVEAGVAQLYVPNPQVQQLVLTFVNTGYVDKVQHLRQTPALLAPESVECLEMLALRNAGHPEATREISLAQALITIARRENVDAARQWLRRQVIDAIQHGRTPMASGALVSAWETALALSEGDSEPVTRAQIEVNLGQAYRSRNEPGDVDRAVTTLERALEVMTREAYPQHFSGVHRVLANIFFDDTRFSAEARYTRAIHHYTLALETLSVEDDPQNALYINFMLGSCWQMLNRPEQARACLLSGLAFVDRAELGQAIATCAQMATVMNGGGALTATALHDALSKLSARVNHLPDSTNPDERASRHDQIANVFRESFSPWRSEDVERAIAHTGKAARIWTLETNPDMWARMQHNLGVAYYQRVEQEKADNIEQAIQYYSNALTVHTREAYPAFWALTHNALGTAWLDRLKGNPGDNAEKALNILADAMAVWDINTDPFHWGECYNSLGAAHFRLLDRYGREALNHAIECFERAATAHTRERFPSRWAELQNNLANAYLKRNGPGDADLAIGLLQQASAATDRAAESYLWAMFKKNEGAAHSQVTGEHRRAHEDAAIAALQDALSVFDADRYAAEHRDTQAALGQMWFRRDAWSDALDAYRNAIKAAERVFERAYTETGRLTEAEELSSIDRNAAFCLLKLGRAHDALELYDRGRTRVLTDAIELSRARFDGLSASQRQEATRARDDIAAAESQMRLPETTPGRQSDAVLGRTIAQARERLSRALGKTAAARTTLTELLRVIPKGGALVVLMLTSRGGVAFVVPHGATAITGEYVVPVSIDFDGANDWLIGTEDQPGLLRTYVDYVNELDHEEPETQRRAFNSYLLKMQAVCQQMWSALMQPIVERLERLGLSPRAPVLMIPHGALALLPLHAASAGPGHCVLQRFDVQYSPSLAVRAQTLPRVAPSSRPPKLLAIADPGGDLAFADIECVELARLFGAANAVVLSGTSATHDAVVAAVGTSTHLHFSCHGFYDWRDPLRSGLVLANEQVLDVAEIMSPQIDLDAARVVVLSACETGLFDYSRYPDEFVGLNSGLLMAGTPAVVSTLWAVEDRSTALLMSKFYTRLLAGESISSAVNQAQRWLCGLTFSELRTWVLERRSIYAADAAQHPELEPISKAVNEWAAQLTAMQTVDPKARPYEHPYYWAAFMALGAV